MPQYASFNRDKLRPVSGPNYATLSALNHYYASDGMSERQIIALNCAWFSEAQFMPTINGGYVSYNEVTIDNSITGKSVTEYFQPITHNTTQYLFPDNSGVGSLFERPTINNVMRKQDGFPVCRDPNNTPYSYVTDSEINVGYSPFPKLPNYNWYAGLPKKVTVYDKNNNLTSYSDYKYLIRNFDKTETLVASTEEWEEEDANVQNCWDPLLQEWYTTQTTRIVSSYDYAESFKTSGWIDVNEVKTSKNRSSIGSIDYQVNKEYDNFNTRPISTKVNTNSNATSGGTPVNSSLEKTYDIVESSYITDPLYNPTYALSGPLVYEQGPNGMEKALELLGGNHKVKATEIERLDIKEVQGAKQIVGGTIRTFRVESVNGQDVVVPDKVYTLYLTEPVAYSSFTKSNVSFEAVPTDKLTFQMDSRYKETTVFSKYDPYLKAVDITDDKDNITSTDLVYNGSRLQFTCNGALQEDVFCSSFEDGEDHSSWSFGAQSTLSTINSHTGSMSLSISLNTSAESASSSSLSTANDDIFKATFFSLFDGNSSNHLSADIEVVHGGSIIATQSRDIVKSTEWEFNDIEVDLKQIRSANSIPVNDPVEIRITWRTNTSAPSVFIDNVRIHPKFGEVESYTYNKFGKITSTLTPENDCVKVEYDHLGRRKLLRNSQGEIIKMFEYSFMTNSAQ